MRTLRQWVGETAGGLPRAFWYIWINILINRVGSFVIVVLAIYLTQVRGLSPAFTGLVFGLWGAGGAVGTLLGGVLSDRWGRKRTFAAALYASAALMLALGLARGPVAIALVVPLLGLVSEAARPAMWALTIDVVSERDRLRAFSLNYWVINLGFACSAVLAGFVAGVDFMLLFAIDAATTAIAATVVAVKVKEPIRVRAPQPAPATLAPSRSGLRAVFGDRVFLAFVAVNLLSALVYMQHISTLPITMSRDGLNASAFGAVIAVNGVLIVAGQLFVPRLLGRLRLATAQGIATVLMGLGFGLTAFADSVWFYGATVLVWTAGEMLNAPSNATNLAGLSPPAMRGRYQGVFSLSWSVAGFLGPIVGTLVLQFAGNTALWLGCFALGATAGALHLLAGPARERRTAELRALAPAPVVEPASAH